MITKNKIDQFMFINSLQITVNQLSFRTILFRDLLKINSIAETNTVRTRFGGILVKTRLSRSYTFFVRDKKYTYVGQKQT